MASEIGLTERIAPLDLAEASDSEIEPQDAIAFTESIFAIRDMIDADMSHRSVINDLCIGIRHCSIEGVNGQMVNAPVMFFSWLAMNSVRGSGNMCSCSLCCSAFGF